MGYLFHDWVNWHFFTVTVDCNSSQTELRLNDVCLTNLYEEFLTAVWISEWSLLLSLSWIVCALCYDRQSVGQSVLVQSTRLGLTTRFFITVGQLRVCWCGALSRTRGRVCRLQLLLALSPLDSRPYFTVSDLRLPISSPPTTPPWTCES
jgi:hypothetical protein